MSQATADPEAEETVTITHQGTGESVTMTPDALARAASRVVRGDTFLTQGDGGEDAGAVVDGQTGELVGRRVLRWLEFPAHLDTGSWKATPAGIRVKIPIECDEPAITGIVATCRVIVSEVELGEATIEGGTWRRDPDDPEAIIYKATLAFAEVEGALTLARYAGLATRGEHRGEVRLGIRHQQLGLDLPGGREASLTERAGEGDEEPAPAAPAAEEPAP